MNEIPSLKEDAKEFLQLIEELTTGKDRFLNKDIAAQFNIEAGRLSNLKNVAREISNSTDKIFSIEAIKELTKETNITVKIVQEIRRYNEIMKTLRHSKKTEKTIYVPRTNMNDSLGLIHSNWLTAHTNAIKRSFKIVKNRRWFGMYYSYQYSQTSNFIYRTPILIRLNEKDKIVEVYSGNTRTPYQYKGLLFLQGTSSIIFSLIDNPHDFEEMYYIQLTCPLRKNARLFRGIMCCLTMDSKPFAGRYILKKITSDVSFDEFESMSGQILTEENKDDWDYEIISYLQDNMSGTMRCFHVTSPYFDVADLIVERKIINQKYSDRFTAYFNSACFLASKNEKSKLQEAFEHLEKALLYGFEDKKQLKEEWENGYLKPLQQIAEVDIENLKVLKLEEDT